MKINRWKRNTHTHTHTQMTEKNKGDKSYSERLRAKWFCCMFSQINI